MDLRTAIVSAFFLLADTAAAVPCSDNDGDGFGSPGHQRCPGGSAEDCNDNEPSINPAAV